MPAIGWIASKTNKHQINGVYAAVGLTLTAYFLYELGTTVVNEGVVLIVGQFPFSPTIEASLHIDMLSVYLAVLFTLLGIICVIYSITYMEHDSGLPLFFTLLLGMVAGMIGVVFAGDFFTLFIFWELMSLTSYALVAFRKYSWEPIEAGFKYLIMSAAGGAILLLAMSFIYGMTGTLTFSSIASKFPLTLENVWLLIPLMLVIIGFGIKMGLVPFHTWLPDAHSAAPSSVSALLSGVMVKTGVYALLRVLLVVFAPLQDAWRFTLAVFAVLTMFTGNLMALLQDDVKRLLAFSTISNIGYIVLGLMIGSSRSLAGSLLHILNHAVVKALLFLCVGSFVHQTQTRSLKELAGIRHTMPITSALFIIGLFGLTGLPPLNLFWSELAIITAGIESELLIFSLLMIGNVAFSSAYCLRVIQIILFRNTTSTSNQIVEAPPLMLASTIILAALCILIGIYPTPFQAIAERAAQVLFAF